MQDSSNSSMLAMELLQSCTEPSIWSFIICIKQRFTVSRISILWVNKHLVLTHWGRVTHICVNKLTTTGSDNGLSPGRCQAIIWTNSGILLIGPLGTNFSEILIKIHTFSFKKMHFKLSSGKWQPFCLGLNVLTFETLQPVEVLNHGSPVPAYPT